MWAATRRRDRGARPKVTSEVGRDTVRGCLGVRRSNLVAAPMNDTITFKSLSGSSAHMKDGPGPVVLSTTADPYAYRWRELRRRQVRVVFVAAACLAASAIGV